MANIEKLLEEARLILKENPIDAGHDLSHHERVMGLALDIAGSINNEAVDLDVLKVASMWHDVKPLSNTSLRNQLENRLNFYKFSKEFSTNVIECINTHSFDKNPKLIEAQILFDADKLDTLSIERGKRIAKSLINRNTDGRRKQIYVSVGKAWIKEMRSKLHFDVSRKIYNERVMTILKSKEVDELARKLNVDLDDVKGSLYKGLSKKEKLAVWVTKNLQKVKEN